MLIGYSHYLSTGICLACKGICTRFESHKQRYELGTRRCTICDVYLKTEEKLCPCCNSVLRGKRKTKKIKK